jgi:hypothetical protein
VNGAGCDSFWRIAAALCKRNTEQLQMVALRIEVTQKVTQITISPLEKDLTVLR